MLCSTYRNVILDQAHNLANVYIPGAYKYDTSEDSNSSATVLRFRLGYSLGGIYSQRPSRWPHRQAVSRFCLAPL